MLGEQIYSDIEFEDATLALRTILVGEGIPEADNVKETPPQFFVNPVEIRKAALDYATSLFVALNIKPNIAYGVLLVALILIAFQEAHMQVFAYAFPILTSFIVLLGLWFSYRYDTVVLATQPGNSPMSVDHIFEKAT